MNKMHPIFKNNFNSILPFNSFEEFDILFDNFFNTSRKDHSSSSTLSTIPRANIIKNEKGYSIELAAPGFSRDEFELSIDSNALSISVGSTSTEVYNDSIMTKEYCYSGFKRSWTLPENTNIENISARYEAGILYVEVPMSNSENNKRMITVD